MTEREPERGRNVFATTSAENASGRIESESASKEGEKGRGMDTSSLSSKKRFATIAIEGCAHGDLDNIYASIAETERANGIKVDLLLCCGDFQAARNMSDLMCMAVPDKYKTMNSFYKYYSGEKTAPYLTIFVGGNHEASNHLQELYYGGWVAPRIYYLGNSGVINYRGIRIAGLSGIYKSHDYRKGNFERAPYDRASMRSVYHVRELDVHKLGQLRGPIDIFLSHDWPQGIEQYGNTQELLRKKKYFEREIRTNTLGSPPNMQLLRRLRPAFWFSAHLHVKFSAIVRHADKKTGACPRCVEGDGSVPGDAIANRLRRVGERVPNATKFLALDKCLPRRHFLQILRIPTSSDDVGTDEKGVLLDQFRYDDEWLDIVKRTHHLIRSTVRGPSLPPFDDARGDGAQRRVSASKSIPRNFCKTVKAYNPNGGANDTGASLPVRRGNPQTDAFLKMLNLNHVVTVPHCSADASSATETAASSSSIPTADANEINISDDDDTGDDNEIDLGDII